MKFFLLTSKYGSFLNSSIIHLIVSQILTIVFDNTFGVNTFQSNEQTQKQRRYLKKQMRLIRNP